MKVLFNSVEEYLGELKLDAGEAGGGNVYRKIVRVTYRKRATTSLPLCYVSVVAGHVSGYGELVELEELVGQVMSNDPESSKVWARAEAIRQRIVTAAQSYGLQVRVGAFQNDA